MRLKAVVKDGRIKFLKGEYNFPVPVTVEVDIPDETLESLTVERVVAESPLRASVYSLPRLKEEHPLTQNIRKLMGNISRRPVDQAGSRDFDWRKEWQKHLEEKYGL